MCLHTTAATLMMMTPPPWPRCHQPGSYRADLNRNPRGPSYPKVRVVLFFSFLSKHPGGSAPNRVFSLSVLKWYFLGVIYFFTLKVEAESNPSP